MCRGKVTGTFTATFSGDGDVTGGGQLFGPQGGKELISGGGPGRDDILLTFTTFLHSVGEGINCFPAGMFSGILQITENTPGSNKARIQYNFKANGTDGTPNIGYTLILRGVVTAGTYAPASGATATITGSPGTVPPGTFEVAGRPAGIACKGTGSATFSAVVENTTT